MQALSVWKGLKFVVWERVKGGYLDFSHSTVYFQYVYELVAHVKIDMFPFGVDLGRYKSLISLIVGQCLTIGVL